MQMPDFEESAAAVEAEGQRAPSQPVEEEEVPAAPQEENIVGGSIAEGSPVREMAPLETLAVAAAAAQAAQAAQAATVAAPSLPIGAPSLRARAAQLLAAVRDRAGGLLGAAKATMYAAKEQVNKQATNTAHFVRDKAVAAIHVTNVCLARAANNAAEAKASAVGTATGSVDRMRQRATALRSAAAERCGEAKRLAVDRATEAATAAQAKALEVRAGACSVAADRHFQVSAASAASGAVALGASGGAVGLTTGGAIGAAVGLVPALFTFGLTIPIGAAVGGAAGLTIGTAVGGTVGAVGGGAAGYGAYTKKEDIGRCAEYVREKAAKTTELVRGTSTKVLGRAVEAAEFSKAQAYASAGYVAEKASAARSRLGLSSTGGTEATE